MKFIRERLKSGDWLAVRSSTPFGVSIQVVLGSYTNHNVLIVWWSGEWWVIEAVRPKSVMIRLDDYEAMINEPDVRIVIRVLRVPGQPDEVREAVGIYAVKHFVGIKYPLSALRMVWYRFFNNLPFKIKGTWCTRIPWRSWCAIVYGVMDRPDGKVKKNETPRTVENRLVAGVLEDVTRETMSPIGRKEIEHDEENDRRRESREEGGEGAHASHGKARGPGAG